MQVPKGFANTLKELASIRFRTFDQKPKICFGAIKKSMKIESIAEAIAIKAIK